MCLPVISFLVGTAIGTYDGQEKSVSRLRGGNQNYEMGRRQGRLLEMEDYSGGEGGVGVIGQFGWEHFNHSLILSPIHKSLNPHKLTSIKPFIHPPLIPSSQPIHPG